MAAPTFTPAQREANLLTVSDLYLRGKTQASIAVQIGCSQQQVSGYLKKLYKRWQADAAQKIDRLKARELARLDKVEAEAWAAWERSQKDAEVETTTSIGEEKSIKFKREGQTGDSRFLDIVSKCIAQRCRILGVDAPTKMQLTGPNGGPVQTQDLPATPEEIQAAIDKAARELVELERAQPPEPAP
jgi:hypothetical protein